MPAMVPTRTWLRPTRTTSLARKAVPSKSARASVVAGRMGLTLPGDAQVHRAADGSGGVLVAEWLEHDLIVGGDLQLLRGRAAIEGQAARLLAEADRHGLVPVTTFLAGIPYFWVALILLYGLGATDAITIVGATIVMSIVSAIAGYLPARHASRVDPLVALHYE